MIKKAGAFFECIGLFISGRVNIRKEKGSENVFSLPFHINLYKTDHANLKTNVAEKHPSRISA